MSSAPVTPSDHDAQLVLEALPLADLLKELATLTAKERALAASLKLVKDAADKIEAIALDRMLATDVPSMTVSTMDGVKMKFSVSSRSFPKMVQGSLVAAQAIQSYAERLYSEERYEESQTFLDMLTIKGSALEPVLREWLSADEELPPEFDGAIEPSTRFSLSKTKG